MKKKIKVTADDHADDGADAQISECLSLDNPVSFFLFAGAGSGKTRSLVEALELLRERDGKRLRLRGQRIGVITYTNKACDEIKARLNFDDLIQVSTIHSFVWSLIENFHNDIKKWLQINLQSDIAELKSQQAKGRAGTKTAIDREKSIESKTKRLGSLGGIKRFTYSPSGENRSRDSLNHSEVINIGADFLANKPVMQSLLVNKFPILLIDESQDTNKLLIQALLEVQSKQKKSFVLGLLGDTMQRIYADGKADLGQNLPADWAKPVKKMNHRSSKRIITLINKIRSAVDSQSQNARTDKDQGFVRLFILSNNAPDKPKAEQEIAKRMSVVTGDAGWSGDSQDVKALILEHHMAAKRMGFLEMYEPLYKNETLRIGLLDGSLSSLRLFGELVLPLIEAKDDPFAVAAIVRKHSPLLHKDSIQAAGADQSQVIKKTQEAVKKLFELWANGKTPNFLEVLLCIYAYKLFDIPEHLRLIASRNAEEQKVAQKELTGAAQPEEAEANHVIDSWDKFLLTPFSQIKKYMDYVGEKANFDTHQGVKGLEFQRVMVIIDDTEARGFSFGYEKLFGVKGKTDTDLENERAGKETGIDRTRRLFYVTCSRAEKSLAIVAYSENPAKVRENAIANGWFDADEIELIAN